MARICAAEEFVSYGVYGGDIVVIEIEYCAVIDYWTGFCFIYLGEDFGGEI